MWKELGKHLSPTFSSFLGVHTFWLKHFTLLLSVPLSFFLCFFLTDRLQGKGSEVMNTIVRNRCKLPSLSWKESSHFILGNQLMKQKGMIEGHSKSHLFHGCIFKQYFLFWVSCARIQSTADWRLLVVVHVHEHACTQERACVVLLVHISKMLWEKASVVCQESQAESTRQRRPFFLTFISGFDSLLSSVAFCQKDSVLPVCPLKLFVWKCFEARWPFYCLRGWLWGRPNFVLLCLWVIAVFASLAWKRTVHLIMWNFLIGRFSVGDWCLNWGRWSQS